MRVALLARRFDPHGGGTERDLIVTADFLARAGHEVAIYAAEVRSAQTIWRIRQVPSPRFSRTLGLLCLAYLGPALARNSGADLILSFARTVHADILRSGGGLHSSYIRAARRWRSRLSWLTMRSSPYHRVQVFLEQRGFLSPSLKLAVTVSEMVRSDLERHCGPGRDRSITIYNGVDLDRFRPAVDRSLRAAVRHELRIFDKAPMAIFVGNGFARKGLRFLLDAWVKVRADACLIVVGADRSANHYMRHACRLKIDGRVRFLGSRTDVARLMQACDALVLPSLFEPFGNVAMEAMACGLPVLTTSACGVSEVLPAAFKQFVVGDSSNVDELRVRSNALLECGREGAEDARAAAERFTWELYGGKFLTAIESVARGPASNAQHQ